MLKKLLRHIHPYKGQAILTPFLVIFEVLFTILVPLAMKFMLDELQSENARLEVVCYYGAGVLGLCVIAFVIEIFSARSAAIASTGLETNLRRAMYGRIQGYSFSNIDKFSTGSLLTRIIGDCINVKDAFQMVLRIGVRAPIMIISSLGMSFYYNWRIALCLLAVIPLLGLAFFFIMRMTFPLYGEMLKKKDAMNTVSQENLTAMRVVKSYVREEYETARFRRSSERLMKQAIKAGKVMTIGFPVFSLGIYICMILVYALGGMWVIEGNKYGMTIGTVNALMSNAFSILFSILMLSFCGVTIAISRMSASRIIEVLDEVPSITQKENAATEVADGSIEFSDVDFSYDTSGTGKTVLEGISFSVKSGETIGIIGGTGSGKSSIVSLIPRLYDINQGCVRVGGVDVRDYDLTVLRKNVAMVLQKNVLFSGTIEENLRWGNENATQEELEAACRQAAALDFVKSFPDGFKTELGQGGGNVSGGQKQRLCIARALLANPKILIFDDSTSAVDTKTDAAIRASLKTAHAGVTKIIIAQRVASVEDADKIIVLGDGKISAMGTHKELLKSSEVYREVYETQTKTKQKKAAGGESNG